MSDRSKAPPNDLLLPTQPRDKGEVRSKSWEETQAEWHRPRRSPGAVPPAPVPKPAPHAEDRPAPPPSRPRRRPAKREDR